MSDFLSSVHLLLCSNDALYIRIKCIFNAAALFKVPFMLFSALVPAKALAGWDW